MTRISKRWARNFGSVGLTVALLSVSSCGNRDGSEAATEPPPPAISIYAPVDDVGRSWGTFDFYRTHATFAAFSGHLALAEAGRLGAAAGEELAGAQVFKIVNADEHFAGNRGREGTCLNAPRWLAVKSLPARGGEPPRIRAALLMLEDWQAFVPGKPGFCGSAVYEAS